MEKRPGVHVVCVLECVDRLEGIIDPSGEIKQGHGEAASKQAVSVSPLKITVKRI